MIRVDDDVDGVERLRIMGNGVDGVEWSEWSGGG